MPARRSSTPYEFRDCLRWDELRRLVVLFGMVKPAEDNDDYLLFAHGYVVRTPRCSVQGVRRALLADHKVWIARTCTHGEAKILCIRRKPRTNASPRGSPPAGPPVVKEMSPGPRALAPCLSSVPSAGHG